MMSWWNNLEPRERRILWVGGVALILLFLYAMVWAPLQSRHQRAQTLVSEQRELWSWMRNAAEEARTLGAGSQRPSVASSGQSLLATIDRTVRSAGLNNAVKRIQPDSGDRVRVWLESAAFDALMQWFDGLQTDQGIHVQDIRLENKGGGRVDVRLTLGREPA